ncbi:MAG: outer membrane lipoprotein-sorting protein [Marinobacter sp.]|nr:outer membrane lipoprotein-sorting protein [Marinobacter sp.]
MRVVLSVLLLIAVACLPFQAAHADTVAEGHALAKAADAQLRGYVDSQVSLTMELVGPSGQTASRALRVRSLETDSGEYTLMVFDTPRDVAGSALLSHNFREADDQQWLYLPAIRRVKQIGARDKSGPFMGSEFAFEDLVTPFYEKFSYRYEQDEACGELTCAIVERIPRDPHSGYTRQRVWIDREHHLIRQVTYYDRRETLLKTYTASDFEQHEGRHWRPATMRMENHQNRRQTRLLWQDFQFGLGLDSRDFTQNALLRAR